MPGDGQQSQAPEQSERLLDLSLSQVRGVVEGGWGAQSSWVFCFLHYLSFQLSLGFEIRE